MMRTPPPSLPLLLLCLSTALAPAAHAAGPFADREEVRDFIEEMHTRHGFERAPLTRLFAGLPAQPKALQAIQPPREPGVRAWQAYRNRTVEPRRIAGGLRFWSDHASVLEAAREAYGVPEEIVVAVLGVETIYGRNTGRFPTLSTLATLAFDYPPRAELFRGELEALLVLARETRTDPLAFRGSYAGAIGLPQFLPSSIRNWAVDFDHDGKTDLARSTADAIGSVARFLAAHGWEPGGPVAWPAAAAGERVSELVEAGIQPRLTPAEMAEYGVRAGNDAPASPCALIDLATPGAETEYRLGYRNFYVLTRYNRSNFYAAAVFDLAETLRTARSAQLASQ